MQNQSNYLPDKEQVAHIVQKSMGESVLAVNRFSTGACHFVYDVMTKSRQTFVVRIARPANKEFLRGATYWHKLLKPKGVPLPNILYSDVEAVASPFPYMIIERLAGEDLGIVYPRLSKDEKKILAGEVAYIQQIAGTLPFGEGYGFASNYESGPFLKTWTDVLYGSLARSRQRIQAVGAIDSRHVERVAAKMAKYEGYFSQVKPRCFLDDTTTRNVIVHQGKLSGIVDVDFVCFGDQLFPIALTRMSLINTGFDLDYIDFWCDAAGVTEEQREVLQFYTALFCVDFMGELGQTFNQERAQAVEAEDIEKLSRILDLLLNQI